MPALCPRQQAHPARAGASRLSTTATTLTSGGSAPAPHIGWLPPDVAAPRAASRSTGSHNAMCSQCQSASLVVRGEGPEPQWVPLPSGLVPPSSCAHPPKRRCRRTAQHPRRTDVTRSGPARLRLRRRTSSGLLELRLRRDPSRREPGGRRRLRAGVQPQMSASRLDGAARDRQVGTTKSARRRRLPSSCGDGFADGDPRRTSRGMCDDDLVPVTAQRSRAGCPTRHLELRICR